MDFQAWCPISKWSLWFHLLKGIGNGIRKFYQTWLAFCYYIVFNTQLILCQKQYMLNCLWMYYLLQCYLLNKDWPSPVGDFFCYCQPFYVPDMKYEETFIADYNDFTPHHVFYGQIQS